MAWLLPYVLVALGAGFAVANVRAFAEVARFFRLRKQALLIWAGPPPPYYRFMLAIGACLGVLLIVKFFYLTRPTLRDAALVWPSRAWTAFTQLFGESMMFVYYAYAVPMLRRIGRGFYAEGVWAETGFIPYHQIGGIAWREGEPPTLLLISRFKDMARPLLVPGDYYSAVRRLLREKIGSHDIMFSGDTLDLGGHDEREDV
jgi:hypothetical protein